MGERSDSGAMWNRREVLGLAAGGLLAAGRGVRAANAAGGEFHFLVVNDVHYVDEQCGS